LLALPLVTQGELVITMKAEVMRLRSAMSVRDNFFVDGNL
jgi:hypothetical protein